MGLLQRKISSKIGPLFLVASSTGLRGIFWREQPFEFDTHKPNNILNKAQLQIEEFLAGKRRDFTLDLDIIGTEFQKQVWHQLSRIPYGETRSYKDIAKAVNNIKAYRAVGTANGKNPFSILVPCHRVIASDGSLGGYAGGLDIKERLLALEQGAQI
jgi:methylated-DNA-[protein]-cysteine S-methyltransferase